jgi:hypothetical protein
VDGDERRWRRTTATNGGDERCNTSLSKSEISHSAALRRQEYALVLEFTLIAQTFETMASLNALDDVTVLSTDPNTIQAGRGFDVLRVSKQFATNRPHFIQFLNVACPSFVVDGGGKWQCLLPGDGARAL